MVKPVLKSISRKCLYLFAIIVIFAAIVVTATRTLSPYLDARRPQIEKWASALLQAPIKVENARVTWYMYEPGVALHNVTLLDEDGKTPLLQLRTVKVFFSIPRSLLAWKPVYSGVTVSGAEIIVHQDKIHGFTVQGFPQFNADDDKPYSAETRAAEVLGFVFSQPRLRLRNIDVRYTGLKGLKRLVTLYNLKIENSNDEHKVSGKAILHQAIPTELSVAADFTGSEPDPAKIQGKIYLNLSGFSLDQWLQGLEWHGWQLKNGLVGAKVWATWGDGALNRVQTSFQLYDINLYSVKDKTSQNINRLSGDVGWKKEQKDQIIAGSDILIDWSDKLWPVTSFYLKLSPDHEGVMQPVTMNIGYLNIQDTQAMLATFGQTIPKQVNKWIKKPRLNGNLEKIRIAFNGDGDLIPKRIEASFNSLTAKPTKSSPGFKNISGKLSWEGNKGELQLSTKNPMLIMPAIFKHPIELDDLVGKVAWTDGSDSANLDFTDIAIINKDLTINLHGKVGIPADLNPQVDINANFTVNKAEHITRYLPENVFSEELNDWLNKAFLAGDVQSGSILLRGRLKDFPFEQGNGEFVISGAINNVHLHYAPDWPDIKNISGTLKFDRQKMLVDVSSGSLLGVSLPQTHAEILNLGASNSLLSIKGKPIQTDLKDAINFVRHSPLKTTIGKRFENAELVGPADINLALDIPLDNPDNTRVSGVINIRDGQIKLLPWKLDVSHIQGNVDFTQYGTNANGLQGELFGKSMQLNIETVNEKKKDSFTRLTVDNAFELKDLQQWLKIPLDKVAKGSTRAQTRIDIAENKPLVIDVTSNLLGVALTLPEQYAKAEDEQRQFEAKIIVDEGKPLRLKLTYADLLRAAMILKSNDNDMVLQGVNLHLGGGKPVWPEGKGIYVTGKLKELTSEQIKKYMSSEGVGMELPLRSIDLTISKLNLLGVNLGKTKIDILNSNDVWNIDVDSTNVSGSIIAPKEMNAKGTIKAQLKFINLDALESLQKGDVPISANKIPAINFSASEVEYYGVVFNDVALVTTPRKYGLDIDKVKIDGKGFKLDAAGEWRQHAKSNKTTLEGQAATPNVSDFLEDLDFDAHNFLASSGKIKFNLNWDNAPYDLSLKTINGNASLDIGKGRIIEISGTSDAQMDLGRMLNIFSLQTIPRRLSLDFSDMFEKGYSFDYLRGDYVFANGDLKTRNMQFDGPVAKVDISGKIGLVDEDFDLKLNVKPYVTSSIPVAATLITGQPVIGIAALIVNRMLSGEVSKAATYSYEVKGPWNDPHWKKVNLKKVKA